MGLDPVRAVVSGDWLDYTPLVIAVEITMHVITKRMHDASHSDVFDWPARSEISHKLHSANSAAILELDLQVGHLEASCRVFKEPHAHCGRQPGVSLAYVVVQGLLKLMEHCGSSMTL